MKKSLIAVVLAGLFTGPVLAEGGMAKDAGNPMQQMHEQQASNFQSMDGNQDGFISRSEAESDEGLTANWEKIDVNADGMLDVTEFSAFEEVIPPGGTE